MPFSRLWLLLAAFAALSTVAASAISVDTPDAVAQVQHGPATGALSFASAERADALLAGPLPAAAPEVEARTFIVPGALTLGDDAPWLEALASLNAPAPSPSGSVASAPAPQTVSNVAATAEAPTNVVVARPRATGAQAEFIVAIASAARSLPTAQHVPTSVTIAQAILESDWGRSGLSRQSNNYFGIKAHGRSGTAGYVTLPTMEVANGQAYWVEAPFRAYATLADSVADHHRFLIENSRYRSAFAYSTNPAHFAQAIHRAGYATDPYYASSLIRLMDRYDLYRYDHP